MSCACLCESRNSKRSRCWGECQPEAAPRMPRRQPRNTRSAQSTVAGAFKFSVSRSSALFQSGARGYAQAGTNMGTALCPACSTAVPPLQGACGCKEHTQLLRKWQCKRCRLHFWYCTCAADAGRHVCRPPSVCNPSKRVLLRRARASENSRENATVRKKVGTQFAARR